MEREEAISLLRGGHEGVAEWNRRREAGEPIPDLSGADLSGAHMAGAKLGCVHLASADLHASDLSGADLTAAVLIFADLSGADMVDVQLPRAHLIGVNLQGANLRGANLESAQLIRANLAMTNCVRAVFHGADLSNADIRGADMDSADLSHALLADADIRGVSLRSANLEQAAVMGLKYERKKLICRGIRVDSCYGNAIFRRDAQDHDWIEAYRSQSRWHQFLYVLWAVTTDCGRSLWRVCGMALGLAFAFGVVYSIWPWLMDQRHSANTPFTPYYYSFVTMTTLGFGDVSPGCMLGEVLAACEVALGYGTLGILVSILSNQVARRS